MKKILSIILGLILCLGMYSVSGAEQSQNFDGATLAMTLAINASLEQIDGVTSCKFWLSSIDEPIDSEAPVLLIDDQEMGIIVFGSTYAAAWLFQDATIFNLIKQCGSAPEVTNIFKVIYN